MNKCVLILAALLVSACATNEEDDQMTSAIDDFIVVNDLEETASIRSYQQFNHRVINDLYVIVYTKKEHYLLAYSLRCRADYDPVPVPDRRAEPHTITARTETFRGCRIDSLYRITEAQAAELMQIGRAPGEG